MQEEELPTYIDASNSSDRQKPNEQSLWDGIVGNVYGHDVTIPTMVFSVIGDSNSFVPSPWPKAVFQVGLIEAAKNGGDTWIIYRGKKHGLSKIIRDAYRDYGNMEFGIQNKDKGLDHKERRVKLISVIETQTNDQLAPDYSLQLTNEKEEPAVIIASNESVSEYSMQLPEVEQKMIEFEEFVTKKNGSFGSQNSEISINVPVPVAIIVCEGDILTIAHIEGALEKKLPVVIVKGSGKAADLIVDYLENQESLKRKASLLFGIRFDDKTFKILDQYLHKIKEKKELISFFDVNKDDPLMFSNIVGEAIVTCWAMEKIIDIKAQGNPTNGSVTKGAVEYSVSKPYSIGFTLLDEDSSTPQTDQMTEVLDKYKEPKAYVMKSAFSTPSSLPLYFYFGYQLLQESNLLQSCGHILILEALKSNRCDYVRVLLDQDVHLKMRDLPVLYKQEFFRDCVSKNGGIDKTEKGKNGKGQKEKEREEEEELSLHMPWILKQINEKLGKKLFDNHDSEKNPTRKEMIALGRAIASSARGLCRHLLKYEDEDYKPGKEHDGNPGKNNTKGNGTQNNTDEIIEDEDTNVSDILLWALFADRKDLAEICWLRSKHHLLTGLVACAILKKLSKKANKVKEQILSKNLENHSILFQKRCLELMDRMYEESTKHAIEVMDDENKVWGIHSSPLTFAYENFMYDIVAHTCSQKNMNQLWYNKLAPDTLPFICSFRRNKKKFIQAPLTKYGINFVLFFSMLVIYSAFVLTSVSTEYYDRFIARFLEYYVYFWGAGDFIEELISCFGGLENKSHRSLRSRIKRHLYDFWNMVDLISYLLLVAALIVRHFHPSTKFTIARRMFSLSLLAMYLRFLEVFLINRYMGPTLIMIKEMLKDLLKFLALAVFVVLGVGMYYHANLWPDHQAMWDGDWTGWRIWKIMYYPYWQLYGEAFNEFLEGKDLSDCSNVTSIWQTDPSMDRCPQEDWTVSAISAVYMLFSNLLLVNLVIAMFSYTFERVQENSEKLWRFQKYTVIIDYKWRIPSPINLLFFPYRIYLYIKKRKGNKVENKGTENDDSEAGAEYRIDFQKIVAIRLYNKM